MTGIKGRESKLGKKGSLLLEAVFGILPFTLFFFLSIELFRTGYLHVLLSQAAFIYTRDKALGKSESKSREDVYSFLESAMGRENGKMMRQKLSLETECTGRTVSGRVHLRYPLFFFYDTEEKNRKFWRHHMEITKRCQFPG